jgi:class 3 adenylate cyclase
MPQKKVIFTILFADIVKSSQFYEILGDKSAQSLIATCLAKLSDTVSQHQGSVVKTIGDEVMCIFPDADRAVKAAKAMQQVLEKTPDVDTAKLSMPNIHIGIHTGPVIKKGDDIFGDAVNLAARMVALAKPRQILITEQTVQTLTPEYQSSVRYVDKDTIKGKSRELKIYEFLWEINDLTVMLDRSSTSLVLQSCLELRYGDNIVRVDQRQPSITMGRQKHNDLVLDYERISRSHARIEYRREKFVLIDQSSNGTYVHPQDEDGIYIKRDEVRLSGTGIISLGRMAAPGSPGAIHFTVK